MVGGAGSRDRFRCRSWQAEDVEQPSDYPTEPPQRPPLAPEPDGPEGAGEEITWLPAAEAARRGEPRRAGQGSVLGAAMLAVGEILEPDKIRVEIQQENDDPEPDLPFTLDFGDLPPLN